MATKDLEAFGQQLKKLRETAGLFQRQVADRLSQLHAEKDPQTDLGVDGNRISKWENAFVDKNGRRWKPARRDVLYLIEVFAAQLTPETARQWAQQAGYLLDAHELQPIFPHSPTPPPAPPPPSGPAAGLERLNVLPSQRLFGVDQKQEKLQEILTQKEAPWLVAIDGIGGIGKTSLAHSVARHLTRQGSFFDVAWVSAKREEYRTGSGDVQSTTGEPALNADTLVEKLLQQLDEGLSLAGRSFQEKLSLLTHRLKEQAHLIVVDNLETAADYNALIPTLQKLANPSKILLTSRHSLHQYPTVLRFNLSELEQADAFSLLRHEAQVRGIAALAEAPPSALENIYGVVGGNPLALKLVVGLLCVLPLGQVLSNLKEAQGKSVDQLYTYIYWRAWDTLSEAGQYVLLVMPLANGGTMDQLLALVPLELNEVTQALQELARLSLVQISGSIEERRYTIHRLTETFLLKEAIRWQEAT